MLTPHFKKRNRKTLKGGMKITPEYDLQTAAIFYLKNCTFKVLSTRGYSCTTFVCDFKLEPTRSPYRGLSTSSTFGNSITSVLLKLNYHAPEDLPLESSKIQHGDKLFKHVKTSELQHEVLAQQSIYWNTLLQNKCFTPICPSVLFCQSVPFDPRSSNLLIDLIAVQLVTEEKNRDRDLTILRNYRDNPLIFTMMECLPGAITMAEVFDGKDIPALAGRFGLEPNPRADEATKMVLEYSKNLLYGLTRMHRIGCVHKDFHMLNTLLVPSYKFGGISSVYIIDFGETRQMTPKEYDDCRANRVACLQLERLTDVNPRAIFGQNSDEQVERLFEQKDEELLIASRSIKGLFLQYRDHTSQFIGYDICATLDMPQKEFNEVFFENCTGRIGAKALADPRTSIDSKRFLREFRDFEDDEL
jgi:hypothetical protein